jgi:hypothetical protein
MKKEKTKVALCISGILGGTSGRNGSGGLIHPVMGYNYWNHSILSNPNCQTDVFIHSWTTKARNAIIHTYNPKKFIIEEQKLFNPSLNMYGDMSIESMKNDRRYAGLIKAYNHDKGDDSHPSHIDGDSNNLWDHLRYQMWCQHSKWYANQKVVSLKKQYENENNFTYDYVILSRFDLYFNSIFPFKDLTQDNFYASPRNWGNSFRNDHDIALMDMWFLAPSKMMDEFANLYDNIYKYCITGPHSSRERVVELFGEQRLKYLFLDGIDYGALRHKYKPQQFTMME